MATTPIVRKYNLQTLMNGLDDREQKFVTEYMIDANAKRAAEAAGYKAAATTANKLLKRPKITKVIAALKHDYVKEAGLKQEEVLEHLKNCITRTLSDFVDPDTGLLIEDLSKLPKRAADSVDGLEQHVKEIVDPDTGEVVGRTIKNKLKLAGKVGSIELGMKHLGMLAPEKKEVKVSLDLDSLYNRPEAPQNVIDLDNVPLIEDSPQEEPDGAGG